MRIWLVILCIHLVLCQSNAQNGNDDYSISVVKNLMQQSPHLATGFSEKQSDRLGDRVSIALLKILDDKDLRDPQTIKKILPLIRGAFIAPRAISIPEGRKPKVTFFLLRYLKENAQNQNLKNEIAEVMDFIKEKTATNK
jgi:L-2-hydroxyglutarate oxidase LhgO